MQKVDKEQAVVGIIYPSGLGLEPGLGLVLTGGFSGWGLDPCCSLNTDCQLTFPSPVRMLSLFTMAGRGHGCLGLLPPTGCCLWQQEHPV